MTHEPKNDFDITNGMKTFLEEAIRDCHTSLGMFIIVVTKGGHLKTYHAFKEGGKFPLIAGIELSRTHFLNEVEKHDSSKADFDE